MFLMRNEGNSFPIRTLIWRPELLMSLFRLFTSKEDDFSMDLDLCDADDMML